MKGLNLVVFMALLGLILGITTACESVSGMPGMYTEEKAMTRTALEQYAKQGDTSYVDSSLEVKDITGFNVTKCTGDHPKYFYRLTGTAVLNAKIKGATVKRPFVCIIPIKISGEKGIDRLYFLNDNGESEENIIVEGRFIKRS